MAGIINKVKEAITGDHSSSNDTYSNTRDNTTRDNTHDTTAAAAGSHSYTSGDGPHKSGIANKLDPRVDSDNDGNRNTGMTGSSGMHSSHTPGTTMGTTGMMGGSNTGSGMTGSSGSGPHNSGMANKLDPRVDSDNDGRGNSGMMGTSSGHHGSSGITGGSGTTSGSGLMSGLMGGSSTGTSGRPHGSNMANKLDPRVDSDNDGSRTTGNTSSGYTGTSGTGLTGGMMGSGHHQTHGHGSDFASSELRGTADGPHQIGLANALDPNVSTSTTGRHHTGAEPLHESNLMNKLDPRTDSTGTSSGHYSSGMTGTGTGMTGSGNYTGTDSSGTSGLHKSSLLNKLDPRVDSDRDGSKTH